MANCQAKTKSGKACGMKVKAGARFCFTHDPATRAAQAQARKRGGANRHTPHAGDPSKIPAKVISIHDANEILNYVLSELLVMDNGIGRARALLQAYEMF